MIRLLLVLCAALFLASCAEPVWAPDDAVARARYVPTDGPSLTLLTMINNRSGEGGHTALLIDASQRVLFDPAGTWFNRAAPERNDVIYGMNPTLLGFYLDYHARQTWHVVMQKIRVSPEVAEEAKRAVEAYGAVPKAMCTNSTSSVLKTLPGFESLSTMLFPVRLMRAFGKLPGVVTTTVYDTDADDNRGLLAAQGKLPPDTVKP